MIAELGLRIDSSGMTQGVAQLDRVVQKSGQAEKATESLGREGSRAGREVANGAQRAGREVTRLAADARRAEGSIVGIGRASDQAAANLDRMASSAGRSGAQLQNAGYQVGDFFVQVAGGTSPTRALAQQLPQLLGGFGAAGAIIGATVAAAGALAPVFLGAKDAAEELDGVTFDNIRDSLGDLTETAETYESLVRSRAATQSRVSDDIIASLGRELAARQTIIRVESAQADRQLQTARERLEAQRDELRALRDEQIETAREAIGVTNVRTGASEGGPFVRGAQERGQLEVTQQRAAAAGRELADVFAEQADEVRDLQEEIAIAESNIRLEEEAQRRVNDLLKEGLGTTRATGQASGDQREAVERLADAQTRAYQAYQQSRVAANENVVAAEKIADELREQIILQSAIAKYGEDSAEVSRLRASAEREAFREMVETLGVSEDMQNELLAAKQHAESLAEANMAAGISAAATEARALADYLGISLAAAARLAALGSQGVPGQNADPSGKVYSGRGGDPRNFGGGAYDIQTAEAGQFLADYKPPKAGRSGRSGGGGGASEAQQAHNERLREAERIIADTRTELEQYNIELRELAELNELGYFKESPEAYARAVAQVNEAFNETQFEQVRQGIESISDSIADAIVNSENLGEAFRNILQQMAADILSSGIKGLLTNALIPSAAGGGNLGGSGGLLGGRIIPGILHDGGTVGQDGYDHSRAFSPDTWAGAKRYHNGGIVGLRPNEVPIIAERGERVVSNKGEGAGGMRVEVVPSPYFDVRVDDRARGVAAPMVAGTARAQQRTYGSRAENYSRRGTN